MDTTNYSEGEQGPFASILAAASTLSPPSEKLGPIDLTNNQQPISIVNNDLGILISFLTREAKVELVSMAPHDAQPSVVDSNASDGHRPINVVCVTHRDSMKSSSPLTSLSLNTSLVSCNPSGEAVIEAVPPKTPLFSSENTKYNIDRNHNTLSVPCEKQTPEKMVEKNFFNFKDGYDTDQEIGPFWDAVEGEVYVDDDLDVLPLEETVPASVLTAAPTDTAPATAPTPDVTIYLDAAPLTEEIVNKMKNSELKAALKQRGLSQNGNKGVLMKRLLDNLQKPVREEGEPERVPNGFPTTAKWRELKHEDAPVEELM
jgi:hypothetical protein